MGTQQRRKGAQQRQSGANRPQQGSDPQRNKPSDRGRQQQGDRAEPQTGRERQQGEGDDVHGEGNYAASRQYNDATKSFTESGRVESAARDAAPRSDADALQMAAAESEGKRRAKSEDPALARKATKAPDAPRTPRPGNEKE
jgi:hypothetical protein